MNEETLPPSFNWFLSNVLACAEDGTIAFGSKSDIAIAKYLPGSSSLTPHLSIINHAHQDRINVVAFSTSKDNTNSYWNCLASSSDDSTVRLWSLDTKTEILVNNAHQEGSKVYGLDWSRSDPNLIVSADNMGNIVAWDLLSNTNRNFNFGKLIPTCLACCPHSKDLVAFGTRSGLVCLISLKGSGKMLYRMRGHDTEVVSLAWCPVSYNVLQPEKNENDMLLASGAKETSVYIWRAGRDGRAETVLTLPPGPVLQAVPSVQHQHRSRLGASAAGSDGGNGCWICVSWPEPKTLLSSSLWGELLAYNLEKCPTVVKSTKQKMASAKLWQLIHACHSRGLFSIACFPSKESENSEVTSLENSGAATSNGDGVSDETKTSDTELQNTEQHSATDERTTVLQNGERKQKKHIVWTLAQDRKIIACDWKTKQIVINIPTMGGFVYCIASSPVDSNRIAFGVGDGTVRVWNLSNASSLEITTLWQKVNGKVMALAWHPTREGWLAYGTSEGRIGLFDLNTGKLPILFPIYLRRNIYSICWGPPVCKKDDGAESGLFLYCCGDGDVAIYNPENPKQESYKFKDIFTAPGDHGKKPMRRSEFVWKPDLSMAAVGTDEGTIQIFSAAQRKLVHKLISHSKLIQCAVWHPESTATDTGYSPYRHWLAVAANHIEINVFDLSQLVEDDTGIRKDKLKPIEDSITLKGHRNRVISICWSPHIGGQLVSVSYDGSAQVWNVPAREPVANFSGHFGQVYSCAWSPLDPDLVITGSSDFTLRVWRVSSQTDKLPKGKQKFRKKDEKKPPKMTAVNLAGGDRCTTPSVPEKQQISSVFNLVETEKDENDPVIASGKIKKKQKILLSARNLQRESDQNINNCYLLLEAQSGNRTEKNELPSYLGLLGDRNDMQRLLNMEVEKQKTVGNWEEVQHIEIWKGNVTEMLKEAACRKNLSDWLVSLAPMASQRLWMEMCKAYAEQLESQRSYVKAASYLLTCHKVNEAIDMLVSHNFFSEALAIAHSRLGPNDPTPKKIVRDWAENASKNGNYELAAQCLISVGELKDAAMLIRKRNDQFSLKLAALLADKAGAQDLAAIFASQSVRESLLSLNWDFANEVASQHPYSKHISLMIAIHRTVAELSETTETSVYLKWLHKCERLPLRAVPLFQLVESRWNDAVTEGSAHEIYDALSKEFGKNDVPNTKQKLWFVVSVELALCYLSFGKKKLHHLVMAMSISHQYRQLRPKSPNLLLQLCVWLTPLGPFAEGSVFFQEADEELGTLMRSLRAYLCTGVVDWVSEYLQSTQNDGETENDNEVSESNSACDKHNIANGRIKECTDCQNTIVGQWHDLLHLLSVCKNDILSKESIEYFQDSVKIKRWEHEAATVVAKSRSLGGEPVDAAADDAEDSLQKSNTTDTDDILLKLQQLKLQKETFERNFISTPNPFMTYCKIKNLLPHFQKSMQNGFGDLIEQYEVVWKTNSTL